MEVQNRKKHLSYSCFTKCLPITSTSSSPSPSPAGEVHEPVKPGSVLPVTKTTARKPGGWKAMPYVLGNETFERLASIGLLANFMIFLVTQFHMEQASAASLINIWSGVTNFAPLIGAFISDSYAGRFRTIAFGSFNSLLGMITLTLIMALPSLHPTPCSALKLQHLQCAGPTSFQLGMLILALGFIAIGSGGVRPCSLPFGLDQFDPTTDEGRKGINSFFNWYYTTFTLVLILALTVVVYIQQEISWVLGFAIPTALMLGSIVLYFAGMRLYVYVVPEGSVFTGFAQVAVASFKKRRLDLPAEGAVKENLYDPPTGPSIVTKLPLTNQFRFLNKAAIVLDGDVNADGTRSNLWRLSSIQQIEETKCLLKVIPVLASGIICFVAMAQQGTFTASQALKMDRHLGPKFEIPPGSLGVISMITVGIFVPLYDRLFVPALRKITKIESGITLLQRIGIGIVFSILSMVVAGAIEKMRRESAISAGRPDGLAPISVMWVAPQLVLMGFAEAFNIIGQIEFYYKEFPENMRTIANALFFVTSGGANYLSSLLIAIIHRCTKGHNRPDWLTNDINAGRLDYFYYVIAIMGVANMAYFFIVSRKYQYKINNFHTGDEKSQQHVELDVVKN